MQSPSDEVPLITTTIPDFVCENIPSIVTLNSLHCAICGMGACHYRFITRRVELLICNACRQDLWDIGIRGRTQTNVKCIKRFF